MNEIFDKIIGKHEEYEQCIEHIHLRGSMDVAEETKPFLIELKKEGIEGLEFELYLTNKNIPTKNDFFYESAIKFLNTKNLKNDN
jgi:hypothetical protein